jgi:hypothetical protein
MGHDFPSPRATLEFLYPFHDEQKMEEAKGRRAPDETVENHARTLSAAYTHLLSPTLLASVHYG